MGMKPVSDPALLQQLEGGSGGPKPVSDPALLQQLEGGSYEGAPKQYYDRIAPEPATWGETGVDVAKSAGVGLAEGAIGLAGAPGDIQGLIGRGVKWAGSAAGLDPQRWNQAVDTVGNYIPDLPTSGGIQNKVEQYTGEFYQPQTTLGEYARTGGQFAAAAPFVPGGLLAKAAMTMIPAVTTETTGQAARAFAPEYEGPVRLATALLSTYPGAKLAALENTIPRAKALNNATVETMSGKSVPATIENVRKAKNQRYDALENSGVKYAAQDVEKLGQYLDKKLATYKTGRGREIADIISDKGATTRMTGGSFKFDEIEKLRQDAGDLAKSLDPAERKSGAIIADALDEFQLNSDLLGGNMNGHQANALQKQARELAQRNIQHRAISEMIDNAKGYQSGLESGLRNQFGNVLKSPRQRRKFTPEVLSAMEDVVRGHPIIDKLGALGIDFSRFSGRNTALPTIANIVASPMTGWYQVPIAATTTAAKYGSRALTQRSANQVLKTALAGRGKVPEVKRLSGQDRLKAALLNANSSKPPEITITTPGLPPGVLLPQP